MVFLLDIVECDREPCPMASANQLQLVTSIVYVFAVLTFGFAVAFIVTLAILLSYCCKKVSLI